MSGSKLQDPGSVFRAVTPSDTVVQPFRAVYVGGAGNLAVIGLDDTAAVTFTGVVAGTLLPIRVSKILATGTTATAIVGLN
jgi:hypothetical protein